MQFLLRVLKDGRGAAAVEFALIAPLLMLCLLSLVAYGLYLSTAHAVQQIAADAARTAIVGVTAAERRSLVAEYIRNSTLSYAFVHKDKIGVSVEDDPRNRHQFTVRIAYDAEDLPIWNLFSVVLPSTRIEKFSTIRIGGL